MKLLLFEDTLASANELSDALRSELAAKGDVTVFKPVKVPEVGVSYESHLYSEMQDAGSDDISLIVADRELSKTLLGLSEPTVRRVAHSLAIPECSYTRGRDQKEYLRTAGRREACIAIPIGGDLKLFARQVISIASGFEQIRNELELQRDLIDKQRSPGAILAIVLGKPEYADKMSLYASGDRQRLRSVLEMRDVPKHKKSRHLSCLLGYWLWDSILRYPGVVVNMAAASSYLNINQEVFEANVDVRNCFSTAQYDGPFVEATGPMWWRGALDDILAEKDFSDGKSYVENVLRQTIEPSECCEEPAIPAGYYCMLSEKPVSLENSTGGLAWFPRGADLARISKSQLEELGPWLS